LRINGSVVPDDKVTALLNTVISCFREPTDDHGVWWSFGRWRVGFASDARLQRRADRLASRLPAGRGRRRHWRYITRKDVFAASTARDLVLAALAWGYGTTGYGWRRSLKILKDISDQDLTAAIAEMRRSFANKGARGVWTSFSAGGLARLRGLGTAFASKVAYYACYDRASSSGPLIADRNSAWGFWAVEGSWDIRASAELYGQYVETAENRAAESGRRSDDYERAYFEIGPWARRIYDDLQHREEG
jgi:hypothetical protein